MADPKPFWLEALIPEKEMRDREHQRMQEQEIMQRIAATNLATATGNILGDVFNPWDHLDTRFWGRVPTPTPPTLQEGLMITFLPRKDEIDETEITQVHNWILDQAAGRKKGWPGYPLSLRVNKKSRYVVSGVWECRDNDTSLYVGNGTGTHTPIWAPSALMAIARCYCLDQDETLVKKIHEMLATIIARDIIPVMTDLAAGYNGSPVTEIAVNKKERIFVGRYPDATGAEGPFRHLTGEIAEINDTDWVRLKL